MILPRAKAVVTKLESKNLSDPVFKGQNGPKSPQTAKIFYIQLYIKNDAIWYIFTTKLELKIYNLFNGVITVIHRSAFSFVFSFLFLKMKEIQKAVF